VPGPFIFRSPTTSPRGRQRTSKGEEGRHPRPAGRWIGVSFRSNEAANILIFEFPQVPERGTAPRLSTSKGPPPIYHSFENHMRVVGTLRPPEDTETPWKAPTGNIRDLTERPSRRIQGPC